MVVAIVSILAALMFPAITTIMERARAADSSNRLRQLASLMALYTQDNNMRLPPAISGSIYWSNPVAVYLGDSHFGVGGNSVFNDPITGKNAINDAGVRRAGLKSPFSCAGAAWKYNAPPLISATFAINAYLYLNANGYSYDWSSQPRLLQANKPASTVLFTHGHVGNFGSWQAAEGIVRNTDFEQTAQIFKSGVPVCWLDGHITFEKKEEMFSSEHRPGGTDDYWSLVK